MKLTYETGTATLIQFIVLGLLNIGTALTSTVHDCRQENADCLGTIFISFIFYLVVVGWFAAVWVLGYMAQERRSRRLAQLLIMAEGLIALVALFDAKHHNDKLGLITSVADFVLALWIISLAWRLMRSGGRRIVSSQRPRRRQHRSDL